MRKILLFLVNFFFPPAVPNSNLETTDLPIKDFAETFSNHNVHWPCHYLANHLMFGITSVDGKAFIHFMDSTCAQPEQFFCLFDGAARNDFIDMCHKISYLHSVGKIKKI